MKVKKLLAGVLAGTLVLGSLAVVSADTSSASYEVSGASWWGENIGAELTFEADSFTATYNIEATSDLADFMIEVYDEDGKYITTGTGIGAWYSGATGDEIVQEGLAEVYGSKGSYTVTIVRDGADFTITYEKDGDEIGSVVASNTDLSENASVHFYAQFGDFTVYATTGTTDENDDGSDVEDDDTDDNDDSDVEDDDTDADNDDADDEEELNAADYNTVVDEYTLEDQYCDGWWTTFSQAIELVEGTKTVITGVTTNCSTFNWNNIIYVLYSSDDGNVYPADSDEAIATNYTEYFVGRADDYGWGVVDFTVLSAPADWDEWLAATQAGAEFTIEALYVDGTVQITITCLDASYVITYAVEDPDTPIYLALTGEDCQLSDLSVVVYEASEDEIVDVDELISETDETAAAAVSGVKTADASLLLLIVLALAGCSAIAFVAKKRA